MNYDLSNIDFLSLVQFKKEYTHNYLTSDLIGVSDSGLYYNTGIITLANIYSSMPIVDDWSILNYAADTTYTIDDIVLSSDIYYISLTDDNIDNTPSSNPTEWEQTTLHSVWIKKQIEIAKENILGRTMIASNIIDHELLYAIQQSTETVDNASKFVGFEIRPKNTEHLKLLIHQVSTQFTSINSDLTLYLKNQNTLVKSFKVDSLENDFSWNTISDLEITGQGRWFLYYDQDDLSGNAINWNFYEANEVSEFVKFYPFEVPNTTTNLLDINDYTSSSYGIGLNITVKADLTNFINQNRLAFARCLQLQFQYNMLDMYVMNYNNRSNSDSRNTQDQNYIDRLSWEVTSDNKHSLISRLENQYKELKNSLKFNTAALPCESEEFNIYISNEG